MIDPRPMQIEQYVELLPVPRQDAEPTVPTTTKIEIPIEPNVEAALIIDPFASFELSIPAYYVRPHKFDEIFARGESMAAYKLTFFEV